MTPENKNKANVMDDKRLIALKVIYSLFTLALLTLGYILIRYTGFTSELFSSSDLYGSLTNSLFGAVLVFISIWIYKYIQSGSRNILLSPQTDSQRAIFQIEEKIEIIKKELNDLALSQQSHIVENKELEDLIKEKIIYNIESVLKENFEEKYGLNALRIAQSKQVEYQIKELQAGVNVQIDKLSRSGTVNLVIGVITTIIAILVLLSLLSSIKSTQFDDIKSLLFYLIPRTTLAIFIEAFSFFFLRLYKTNLEDVKYFHNERTNIDSKIIALKVALSLKSDETIIEVVKSFLSVERNFIIKNDETTIHTEQTKINNQQEVDFLSRIADIVEKFKKS